MWQFEYFLFIIQKYRRIYEINNIELLFLNIFSENILKLSKTFELMYISCCMSYRHADFVDWLW